MSIRFIYGRAGSGKSHFCYNEIRSKIQGEAKNPLILIVPEQYSLQAEKNLIKTLGTGGILRAEVLSFGRLAYRVFSEVGGMTAPHLNSASKSMLIYQILERLRDELTIFSKASEQQGFVNTVSDLITELKRHNITPERLGEVTKSAIGDEFLKNKLNELNAIYIEYEKTIHEKYRDSDDDLKLLYHKLDKSTQFHKAEIWLDEFSGFTPQEYQVVGKLMEKAETINVSICSDCLTEEGDHPPTDVFSSVKSEIYKLLKIAKEKNIPVLPPVILKEEALFRFQRSQELLHLEKNLFSFPYSKYTEPTRNLGIFSAVNIYSEIEDTAGRILALCRDQGFRYKEMGVLCGNLGAYEKLISAVFTSYGIPFFIDRKMEITRHPAVQLLLSMLDIFNNHWSYEAVFSYLKTGLTGIREEDVDLIENYVLACGIRGSKWTNPEEWTYKTRMTLEESGEEERELLTRMNLIRGEIQKPLLNFREKTKGKKTSREICEALYEFLCELEIPEKMEARIEEFKASGQIGLSNEYGQVWNIIMEVFSQISEVLGEDTVNIEKFSNLLKIGLNEYKIGLIPPSLDQVLVGSVERSKQHEVKGMFILGVNDGVFPSPLASEGIMNDNDRESLKAAGLEIAKTTRSKAFEEQFMIYTALTVASDFLRLSYPIADQEGRSLRPAMILSRIRKLFPHISETSNLSRNGSEEEEMERVTAMVPTFHELLGNLRKSHEGEEIKPLWRDVHRFYQEKEEWKKKCEAGEKALYYSNQTQPIHREKIRRLYGQTLYSSVSRFERYSACPFSYYVQYGLKAKERRMYKLNPPDIGTFMHAVIEAFSRQVSEGEMTWREVTLSWCTERISEIVEEMLEKMQGSAMNGSKRYLILSGRLKRTLVRAAWLIAEHIKRSSFEPIGYEVGFGEGEEFPAITIELSTGEKISLTGRIDRIDAMKTEQGTYLRIIDYKSGAKAFKLSDVYYGMQIQLITYLDAIWENGGKGIEKPILPGGMLYFKIDDPIVKGSHQLTEEDIEKAIIKELRMKGLLLADIKLIREMDHQIDGTSHIIPARINKGDVLGHSSAATLEQFEILRKYVKSLLQKIGEEMLRGEIPILPFKNKNGTPCKYCEYGSICQFDGTMKDNLYRVLKDRKDEEVWEEMKHDGGK